MKYCFIVSAWSAGQGSVEAGRSNVLFVHRSAGWEMFWSDESRGFEKC